MRRQPFTDDEDDQLTEFIAKNNPDGSGRRGNKLYMTLVDNPKRWPWSSSHPWQSWRERYIKNSVWFDKKIKRYLRKQTAAREAPSAGPSNKVPNKSQSTTKSPKPAPASQEGDKVPQTEESAVKEEEEDTPKERAGEDDYMHELFGSFAEDEDEEATEPEDPPASSAPSSPTTERIYPDLRDVPPPDIAEKGPYMQDSVENSRPPQDPTPLETETSRVPSPPPPPPPPPRRSLQGEKRPLKRKVPDDDPFIDNTPPPSSPIPQQHPAMRKVPPVLHEGPFRNRFVQTRNSGENNRVVVWPPNRKRKENEGSPQNTESHSPKNKAVIGQKSRQQVNAIASSSKIQLPPPTAVRLEDPFLIGTALHKSAQTFPIPNGAASSKKKATTVDVDPDKRINTDENGWAVVAEQPPAKRHKFGHPPDAHQELAHSTLAPVPTSSPVTFVSNHSRGNPFAKSERPATRRIDLRESLKKRRLRSLLSSRGSTASISISNHTNRRDSAASSTSRHRRQHVANDEDLELISLLERDLAELGEQYGFALGVVKRTYLQFGTLEKTVIVLRAMHAIMKGAQDKLFEEMEHLGNNNTHDTDDEDAIPEGVIPKTVSSRGKKEIGERESHSTPTSNKRHRQSLNYKPLTTDVEDQSEYSPPSRSRAGRYTKLQKEGREEDALIAASGGRFTPHLRNESKGEMDSGGREVRHLATTIKRGMEPSSPLDLDRERSPTPEVAGLRGTDGEEEGEDDIELAIEHDGMDVSPDQHEAKPTAEVEQVDDEEVMWKAEHRRLCFEATLGDQEILKAFKEREDYNSLRRESEDLIMERISTMKEAQEIRRQEHYRSEAEKSTQAEENGEA